MKLSLKKVYELLHFPLFLLVLISSQLLVGRGDSSIQARIDAVSITPLEQDVLRVLYCLANLASIDSILIAGPIILIFTIVSPNHRQFIVNQALYLFFLFFFEIYFFSRLSPEMMPDMSILIGISVIMACALVAAFSGVPALIIRKMKAIAMKKREGSSIVAASFKECKDCGTKFLSNPVYCAKCLTKLS